MLPVCGCRRGGRFSTDDLNTRSLFYWIPKIERDSVDILDWSQIQVYKPRSIRKCCGNSECSGGRCDRPPRINFGLHSRDIGGMFIQLNKRWYEKKNRYFILYSRCKQTRANNSEATSAWKLWIGWQLRYSFEWKKKTSVNNYTRISPSSTNDVNWNKSERWEIFEEIQCSRSNPRKCIIILKRSASRFAEPNVLKSLFLFPLL